MNYLEAVRIARSRKDGLPAPFLLAMSGTVEPLTVYIRAEAVKRGQQAIIETLPFNTLSQYLLTPRVADRGEVILILPWDLAPELDWRSGIAEPEGGLDGLLTRLDHIVGFLADRPRSHLLYLPAPIPPLFADDRLNRMLPSLISGAMLRLGAQMLPESAFGLGSYLASGSPIASRALGDVARMIVQSDLGATNRASRKVLATDLDNVLWAGVIAEDGVDGIAHQPDGAGFAHFTYQTLLLRLKNQGILLAGISRNDPGIVADALKTGRMRISEQDFICVLASYNAKSAQIRSLAEHLNLGLESFVFVDDNPIELAEVAAALPGVECLAFPSAVGELPGFYARLSQLFSTAAVTAEDRARTDLYRTRVASMVPRGTAGANLTDFLKGLRMTLTLHQRDSESMGRAIQLINKTTQFNLNGYRVDNSVVTAQLAAGARLYSASLTDRSGDHGEILVCLMQPNGLVTSLVMSCRVFERRVEFAFLAWLAGRHSELTLQFRSTPRNEPMRRFLEAPAFRGLPDDTIELDAAAFVGAHHGDLALFSLYEP